MALQPEPPSSLPPEEPCADADRRDWMRGAACMAAAWAASGSWPAVAGAAEAYPRSLLVGVGGQPLAARDVRPGEALLFNYPFVASPAFLLAIEGEVASTPLASEAKQQYAAPAGVGPGRSIVAFSAICAHKLMYPTPELSFIGVRRGAGQEPAQVIHCCGDNSRYDPAHGARVLAGPAPQPLAAVLLEWDAATDRLHAVGMRGGEMFTAFFEKYAFKLEMALGSRAHQASGATTLVQPASSYSKAWHSCRA